MNFIESIWLALDSIRVNKLRAGLTLLSISIGVFAIIGAGALVESINNTVNVELEKHGRNSFFISKMPNMVLSGKGWRKYMKRKNITWRQAEQFKKRLTLGQMVSLASFDQGATIEYGARKTNPTIYIYGADQNFIYTQNSTMDLGRPLIEADINYSKRVCMIGADVVKQLFPNENPIGKKIKVKGYNFQVIGTLASKGAMMGQSQDGMVVLPITQFLTYFSNQWNQSLWISIRSTSMETLEESMDEAIGVLRGIRNVKPWEENDFEVATSESISEQFSSITKYLTYFGFISGAIALIAAGVGIMNIMLVSVKERTREIGIRKAIGAKSSWVLWQFIVETVTLCQVGGFIGILLGVGAASLFGGLLGLSLKLPLLWILFSMAICTALGLISGAYPAWKAAKLDPIEALRYE
ncbi:MAG: ABC transporter permease [Chloroflexota bacterium]